jgi:hypothetical protein
MIARRVMDRIFERAVFTRVVCLSTINNVGFNEGI